MSLVYWDSMLFIYLFENNPNFGAIVTGILKEMEERGDTLCTSVFAIGEVLTGPKKSGLHAAADAAKSFLLNGAIEILPFTVETAERFSMVRATTNAKPPDAIHLAAASVANVDIYLTGDRKLLPLQIPGIQFIAGLDGCVYGKYRP